MTGWPVLEIELFGIVSLCDQDLANTCLPQSLVITNFNRMNASGNQRCIALPFVISRMSFSHGRVLILSLPFFTPTPLMTPSSPNRRNTKPWPLLDRCCYHTNSASSGWSSLWGLQPEPGSRYMTSEKRWRTQRTLIAKVRKKALR